MTEKVCKRCEKPHETVYGGKYPRHVCQPCQLAREEEGRYKRAAASVSLCQRAIIYAEAGGKCALCGTHTKWSKENRYDAADDIAEVDHIEPVHAGGSRGRANLRLLCKKCNRTKGGSVPTC